MRRSMLMALAVFVITSATAAAEPLELTPREMDSITAGALGSFSSTTGSFRFTTGGFSTSTSELGINELDGRPFGFFRRGGHVFAAPVVIIADEVFILDPGQVVVLGRGSFFPHNGLTLTIR